MWTSNDFTALSTEGTWTICILFRDTISDLGSSLGKKCYGLYECLRGLIDKFGKNITMIQFF